MIIMFRVFVFLVGLFSFSCSYSIARKDKINKAIDGYMFKTLSDYKSYEPVETTVPDSLFTSLFTDEKVVGFAKDFAVQSVSLKARILELEYCIEDLEKTNKMSEVQSVKSDLEKCRKELDTQTNKMKSLIVAFCPEHIGWKVKHTYRSKVLGFYTVRDMEIKFTKDFSVITGGSNFSFITDMFEGASGFLEDFIEESGLEVKY